MILKTRQSRLIKNGKCLKCEIALLENKQKDKEILGLILFYNSRVRLPEV